MVARTGWPDRLLDVLVMLLVTSGHLRCVCRSFFLVRSTLMFA
jgi:hypothetical protein